MLNFKYDVKFKEHQSVRKYDEERNLLHEFNASNHGNVCMEYATPLEAKNAAQALVCYVKKTRTPIIVSQREKCVFLRRREGKE